MSADPPELARAVSPVASRHFARSRNALLAAGIEYMASGDPRRRALDARYVATLYHMQALVRRAADRIRDAQRTAADAAPGSDPPYTSIAAILLDLDAQLAAVPDLVESVLK
jgi:hypothetical protein